MVNVWEKKNKYYCTEKLVCNICGERIQILGVRHLLITKKEKQVLYYCIDCNREESKKKNLGVVNSKILVRFVPERPERSLLVGDYFEGLVPSKKDITVFDEQKLRSPRINDKTIHANRETLEGSSIGLPAPDKIDELESINEGLYLLDQQKEAIPIALDYNKKKLLGGKTK